MAWGAHNYGRDGAMAFGDNGGRSANYEPNSYDGPAETGAAYDHGYDLAGRVGRYQPVLHPEDNDHVQAGALYRVMDEAARGRLVENLAGSLAQVSKSDVVERSVAHFASAKRGVRPEA